ncbi:zinc finger protein 569-like isoform X1 [Maniola hyperantus]|uniref:zinc finger protein 569-like isoform X1 n=1 Tax=Aphantopus hyperantus TaxID=2795564 RepID=UPI0015691741|nr:zinc finger protein 569-like isoform X1 [Maniola hyperantus]
MASDESDDEPLSILAAAKKENPEEFEDQEPVGTKTRYEESDSDYEVPKKKKKKKKPPPLKKLGVTIKINRKLNTIIAPPVIARPTDVWLYLKDLNPTGPYSCLLCPDWFINRSKMILHYALNHKKDYCGICRYFVPDREAWFEHEKFHSPWPCSQCIETFSTERLSRNHLKSAHNLVHCRLCHFRVTADADYNSHLFQKHGVTNVASKDEEFLWEIDSEYPDKFFCLLCIKTESVSPYNVTTFFGHFMGIHHFTLKCLANIIAGRDTPFLVNGAEVSDRFLQQQLKEYGRLGYVDLEPRNFIPFQEPVEFKPNTVLIPEVKEENLSDTDDKVEEKGNDNEMSEKDENSQNDETIDYQGDEDFDITHTEVILFAKCYHEYIDKSLNNINNKTVPVVSHIEYGMMTGDIDIDIECSVCKSKFENAQSFTTHLNKMHSIKTVPLFSCRVCATTFDTYTELTKHVTEELGDFEDLWICQFCDKEFDNREQCRTHLTEHWTSLDFDNCFSPHLGFKCKYCPMLFWNETERETHQTRVHFSKYKDEFYKCDSCSTTFSDKVWYIHHHIENHSNEEQPIYLIKCCLCCTVEPSVDKMRNHFEDQHPEIRKLYCSLDACMFKPLSHRKSFKLHVKMIHGPSAKTDKPVSCNICSREFVSARSCSTHMAQVHGPGKFKCKLCQEVLQTIDERKLHYLLCHPGRHPFECNECGKSFQYKSSLYMHKQDHQPNKQSYTCNYCGKVFAKKDSYREHVQIHEGPRHACSYCPMRFVQRSNMLRHERRHTGERPYRCAHCPRAFADKGACTAHTRTHVRDTSFACLYCGQTFVQKSKLTYHIRKHTGEKPVSDLESCTVCAKVFTSACALREHMKTHVEKRQIVKCPLCDKGYQDERYMLRHLRTMHTRAQFSCPLCHKLLTSAAGLRHHVITHSKINSFRCKCCPKTYAVKRTMIKHLRKRHGLRGTEVDLKDYFTRIEPRDCELNLDEATMNNIFGPPKLKVPNLLISNFVNFADQPKVVDNAATDEGDDSEEENENDNENNDTTEVNESEKESNDEKETELQIKVEVHSGDEELEPTDFVSVKIEHMDEDQE